MASKKTRYAMILATLVAAFSFAGTAQAEFGIDDMFRDAISKLLPKNEQTAETSAQSNETIRVPVSRAEIQLSFAPVVKQVANSVVNVYGTRKQSQFRSPFAGDPFFERFFGEQRRPGQSSLGSGVIVDADGTILTNNHVIENMDELKIALADGREFEVEIVLKDKKSDLAVLKVEDSSEEFDPIDIGNSENVEVGDLVLAIGNPFGVGQTVTSGIVSAVSRTLAGVNDYGFFIQTDASINPGNSGGALVDMQGRLIGINTMIYSKSGGSVGIGYAIPSNMTRIVLNSAETGDRVTRPWIGASFQNVTSEIAESIGLGSPKGALVLEVEKDGPAEKSGLQPGDIVLSVNDQSIDHPDALGYRLDIIGVGNSARFSVLNRGKEREVEIALLLPPETIPRDIRDMPERTVLWGARVANMSPALAQEVGLSVSSQGVVVMRVAHGSPAAYNGLRPGDYVRQVNGVDVDSTEDLERMVSSRRQNWHVVFERDGKLFAFENSGNPFRRFLQ